MSWLTSLFSGGVDKVVDSVSKGLDNLFTSDAERLEFKNELQTAMNNYNLEIEKEALKYELEITKRWTSDNEHVVTRLVRPVSYSVLLFLFCIVVLADGNIGDFKVGAAYIPVIQNLLITMTIAYFGSRGYEKVSKGKS